MNPEYKSRKFLKDQYIKSTSELKDTEDLKTKKILANEHTEYTAGANRIIQKVQQQYLQNKRYMEIDKALDERDKERFIALTSKGWERVL
ncbi:IDEAL domain-containing protein [Bacillus sp. V5-8f]|uniref:IDEAL domain-containing protein n=1 Tax=Bacillus sp. V5-8f TaxID=2053044 RepID=UPI000C775DDE|nr:IDEAL domain-containing protein [Bacillus sp. V5-8f]PLT33430.1 hypothetical protein CUU64_14175 [Bacillus sp. V5-8f]